MPRRERLIGQWDRRAGDYERRTASIERRLLAASRRWVCERAAGRTLELAVGTGLNFPCYPAGVRLTGVDWSARMVRIAAGSPRAPELLRADAAALPFRDATFDAVVCTFGLCCVPDVPAALAEAARVLRPGGRLLLADHVIATNPLLRLGQHAADLVTVPWQGEHYTRRPLLALPDAGLTVVETERLSHGAIERVHARRPGPGAAGPRSPV